jgi:hypothetical protein
MMVYKQAKITFGSRFGRPNVERLMIYFSLAVNMKPKIQRCPDL